MKPLEDSDAAEWLMKREGVYSSRSCQVIRVYQAIRKEVFRYRILKILYTEF